MNHSDPTNPVHAHQGMGERELDIEEVIQLQNLTEVPGGEQEPVPEESLQSAAAILPSAPIPIPKPPILPKRNVSGRYRSAGSGFQLELRVDVDGKHPLKCVSGDFFQTSGATTTYYGSFSVNAPTILATATAVTIEGVGEFTFKAGAPKVRVTIPRRFILQPPAPATVQFLTLTNQPGASYLCQFESAYFRTVQYETDRVSDVTASVFQQYDTGLLPSGGPGRVLSVVSAYAEAGIEVQVIPSGPVISASDEGADHKWSDSELHASMVAHFSQWHDIPQWKVWELAAQLHEFGPSLLGIMFDSTDQHQRQGCACFYAGLAGDTPDKRRTQLYCYVHELGHCFNLLHSWQKSFANPPGVNRPAALSYMNYPQLYPGGSNPFWNSFAFQFDDPELLHLRHAFRNHIIMGGDNFTLGSAFSDPELFRAPLQDQSGLQLELSVANPANKEKSFLFGEPVTVKVQLTSKTRDAKAVHPYLHPNTGLLQIGICNPDRDVRVYRPLIDHCVSQQEVRLDTTMPAVETSIYCGFGKDGFYFDRTGFYQVRAIYTALDGSQIKSNILHLRVRHPVTTQDEEVADLFFGRDQGTLLYLLGSDSEHLQHGNDAFNEVLDKHPTHPLADYVRMLHGINAARDFATITPENTMLMRAGKNKDSIKLLSTLVEKVDTGVSRIDPITMEKNVFTALATAQRSSGDTAAARKTEARIGLGVAATAKAGKAA